MTTERILVRVSSLACARFSHRANKNCRESAPAAATARAEPKPHGIPAATPKRFSPSPSKKRSRVTAPGRTVFNSPRARPTAPALRSELQTDRHWKRRRRRAISQTRWKWGLILARNGASWYGPSALVKVVPPSPAASTLTMLAGPGDFAFRISRRGYCQERVNHRRRSNDDGNGLRLSANRTMYAHFTCCGHRAIVFAKNGDSVHWKDG